MERKKASDFDPQLLELFDGYVHGQVTKRAFFDQAAKFAVGGVTVAALVDSLMPNYALAEQISPDDPEISGERITYESPDGHGTINGYLVKPAGVAGPVPGVVVVHENRGLNPYIEDVARRVAKAGFTALAPDGLTPLGGYPGNDDDGRAMQKELDRAKLAEDFFAAFETLSARDDITDKVGVTGFCYGGGISNAMAVRYPELAAAVPFYGGLDERINQGWPAYEAALKENDKTYTVHFYENANHGFHNDTTPRYDEAAATLAWERTIAFFGEHLSA